jgi:Mlc titration factor MtfA (ptsG expression regulator)
MFHWLRDHRRKKILEHPFPAPWRTILENRVRHYSFLDHDERTLLEQLVQIFVEEKNFEGCNGLAITDEIRVVIAAEACLLVLGLEHDLYPELLSILVYPSTVVVPPRPAGVFTRSPLVIEEQNKAIYGQAMLHGPVVLVWDEVARGARHPETGHNVVYHEFAHLLDMESGAANGTPRLHSRDRYKVWAEIFSREFETLRRDSARGKKTFLDPYGALNEAEFFAVATEYFFDKPVKMQKRHPQLYTVLSEFYRQDPAARQRRAMQKKKE